MRAWLTLIRQISLRHLRGRRLRSALTIFGIAVGVAFVFAIQVVNGTLVESAQSSARQIAGSAQLEVSGTDQDGVPDDLVDRIEAIEGVRAAVPVLRQKAVVAGPSDELRTQVFGVTLEVRDLFPPGQREQLAIERVSERGRGGPPPILLSESLTEQVGAEAPDEVTIETPGGEVPARVAGRISGSVLDEVNGGELGAMALPRAQAIFQRPGRVSSIYILAEPGASTADLDESIEEVVGGSAVVGPPEQRTEAFEKGFESLTVLVSFAAGLGLFVAVFIVFNTLGVAITERRRELATAFTLGATNRQLIGALAFEAFVLGLIGSIIGIALGLLMTDRLVERTLETYEFVFPDANVGSVVVGSADVALALIGGIAVSMAGALAALRRVRKVAAIESLRPHAPSDALEEGSVLRGRGRRLAIGGVLFLVGVAGLVDNGSEWQSRASLFLVLAGTTVALPVFVPRMVAATGHVLERLFGVVGRTAGDSLLRTPRRTTATVAALLLPAGFAIALGGAVYSYQEQGERDANNWHDTPLKVSAESFAIFGSDQPLPEDLGGQLEEIDGIAHAYPERRLLMDVDGELTSLYAVPVAASLADQAEPRVSPIRADDTPLVEGLADGGVVISRQSAERLDLEVGGEISVPTPQGRRDFAISGTFDELAPFNAMFIEHERFLEIWGDPTVDEYSLVLDPGADRDEVAAAADELVESRNLRAEVLTQQEKVDQVLEPVQALSGLVGALQFAGLFVAALAITNTLFTSVYDRRWEIAMCRLIGMQRAEIGKSITLEALSVGIVGSIGALLIGLPLGIALVQLLERVFSWNIAFEVPFAIALVTVIAGVVAAVLAGIYPRRAAVRAQIASALRNE